jgi:hypothetical protein
MYTNFRSENLKDNDHSEELGVDRMRVSELFLNKHLEFVDLIQMTAYLVVSRSLNTVKKHPFP